MFQEFMGCAVIPVEASVTTVDAINPAGFYGPQTVGIMVYSLLWVMQDLYHQP